MNYLSIESKEFCNHFFLITLDDQEMEQIVKLGKASEGAREAVTDESGEARASGMIMISSTILKIIGGNLQFLFF